MAKTVIGIFTEREEAEDAINELKTEGYNPKDISIVMKDRRERQELADDTGTDAAAGALSGASTGAILGGLAGLLASFAIPGLGAFFIGGPIAASLGLTGAAATTVSGAATGALAGGILGVLTGLGLSEDDAKVYESRINEGAILLAVPAEMDEEDRVGVILEHAGADQIKSVDAREDDEYIRPAMHDESHHAFAGAKGGRTTRR